MMRKMRTWLVVQALLGMLLVMGLPSSMAQSGKITLINNSGTTSEAFFIDGEPTLVMNGFDLTPLGLSFPVTLDVVTIAVNEAVPGAPVRVVVYEDSNGGSPIDARLVTQTEVAIQTPGVARIQLPTPATINAPVVWVGFYLPIGFRFFVDQSGSSVLTYWAWSPGTTFDLSDLSSAQIFGPADGSDPVGVNQGGIARITAEIIDNRSGVNEEGVPIGTQIQGGEAPLNVLENYPYCGELLFFDPEDISVTAQERFDLYCRADLGPFSPGTVRNEGELPAAVPSYERRGILYEVFAGGEYQDEPTNSERLYAPVTHCLRPEQADLDNAVFGIAYGAPRQWEILPTQRYGELICAEVTHIGFVSYFVPRTGEEPDRNVDLYVGDVPVLTPNGPSPSEGFYCLYPLTVSYAVHNEGFEPSAPGTVRVQLFSERTGTVTMSFDYPMPSIQPGETVEFNQTNFMAPDTFIGEAHSLRVIVDAENDTPELNEMNNTDIRPGYLIVDSNRC